MSQDTPPFTETETLLPTTIAQTQIPAPPTEDRTPDTMQSDPLMILVFTGIALYLAKLWWDDLRAGQQGERKAGALPGASPAGWGAIGVAVLGALVILGLETGGEYLFDLVSEQSNITWLFLLSMLTAAFIEELIFRGYLVVTNRGRAALLLSIFGFSLLFTILHSYLWKLNYPEDAAGWQFWTASFEWTLTPKAWFSSLFILLNSLWFYTVRFYSLNPQQSLLPCVAAHFASNLGVFIIKLVQGHVVALY